MTTMRMSGLLAGILLASGAAAQARPESSRSTVSIRRDTYGVPHVFARTTHGLFYGFGYALAEDQLYQIELLKRTARGRLAEVFGPDQLDNDRIARRRYDVAALARQYLALPAGDQAIFRGMADGINARIREVLGRRGTLLPKGFLTARFLPEAWTATDVIAIYEHSMVLRFSDLNAELDNLVLLTRLRASKGAVVGGRLFDQLRPVDDPQAPTTVPAVDASPIPMPAAIPSAPTDATLPNGIAGLSDAARYGPARPTAAMLRTAEIPHASNAWAAGPSRTGDGSAILVNGPQMGDFSASYIWGVGLHGAGFNVVGSAPVGSPWLIFGTNGRIGWGATAGLGDTTDIYQEGLDPADPHRYMYRGAWRTMTARHEAIAVRGSGPVTLTVWSTVHGPVDLFDTGTNRAYARRRSWDGREVSSLVAWVRAMQATDYTAWRARVSRVAISVNNYYVDSRGNIAYQFLGRFPLRPVAQDPRLPVIGDGSMEWTGFVQGEQNPHVLNPRGGVLANWNNRPQPGYPSSDFMPWTRVDRVNELDAILDGTARLDRDAIWEVIRRSSYIDVNARYFRAMIAQHATSKDARSAAALLGGWTGTAADPGSHRATPQYLLFRAFLEVLLPVLYSPILPTPEDGPARKAAEHDLIQFDPVFPALGVKAAVSALTGSADNPLLAGRRPADLVDTSLAQAWRKTIARYGNDPTAWIDAAQPHLFATRSYAGVLQTADADALRLPTFMNRGTENDRIVFKAGRVDYCDVTPPGQSSFVAPDGSRSPHFADQLPLYATFGCKRQWLDVAEVRANTKETHRLIP